MHAGHELTEEDLQTFKRVHLLPYELKTEDKTIDFRRTMVDSESQMAQTAFLFSCLHFVPKNISQMAFVYILHFDIKNEGHQKWTSRKALFTNMSEAVAFL
jgi:hypothetical protein